MLFYFMNIIKIKTTRWAYKYKNGNKFNLLNVKNKKTSMGDY